MENNELSLQIHEIEKTLSITIPQVYKDFLNNFDDNSEAYTYIYPPDEVLERNLIDEVNLYAENYLIIGDDGGDNRYLMKSGTAEKAVYVSDCGDLNPDNFEIVSESFSDWHSDGFPTDEQDCEKCECCTVILIGMPDSLSDLVKIKNEFKLSVSSSELLKKAKSGGLVIAESIYTFLAERHLKKLGELSRFIKIENK